MTISMLNVDGTHAEIYINNATEEERNKQSDRFEEILRLSNLGVLNTLYNSNGNYITSVSNAKLYEAMYGWQFVTVVIAEL